MEGDLENAIISRDGRAVLNLLNGRASPDLSNEEGLTMLHIATRLPNPVHLRVLLEYGARCNRSSPRGATPLHFACLRSCLESVNLLVQAGARVDALDLSGRSPLHFASHPGIVDCLVRAGADLYSPNNNGETSAERLSDIFDLPGLGDAGTRHDSRDGGFLMALPCLESKALWNDRGSGATMSVSFFSSCGTDPRSDVSALEAGYRIVGHSAVRGKKQSAPLIGWLVTESADGDILPHLLPPVSYEKVWDDRGTGCARRVAIWRPVAPAGYVALGYVVTSGGRSAPSLDLMRCVHQSLTVKGRLSSSPIWNDKRSGGRKNVSIWLIEPSDDGGVSGHLFVAVGMYRRPDEMEVRVLKRSALSQEAQRRERLLLREVQAAEVGFSGAGLVWRDKTLGQRVLGETRSHVRLKGDTKKAGSRTWIGSVTETLESAAVAMQGGFRSGVESVLVAHNADEGSSSRYAPGALSAALHLPAFVLGYATSVGVRTVEGDTAATVLVNLPSNPDYDPATPDYHHMRDAVDEQPLPEAVTVRLQNCGFLPAGVSSFNDMESPKVRVKGLLKDLRSRGADSDFVFLQEQFDTELNDEIWKCLRRVSDTKGQPGQNAVASMSTPSREDKSLSEPPVGRGYSTPNSLETRSCRTVDEVKGDVDAWTGEPRRGGESSDENLRSSRPRSCSRSTGGSPSCLAKSNEGDNPLTLILVGSRTPGLCERFTLHATITGLGKKKGVSSVRTIGCRYEGPNTKFDQKDSTKLEKRWRHGDGSRYKLFDGRPTPLNFVRGSEGEELEVVVEVGHGGSVYRATWCISRRGGEGGTALEDLPVKAPGSRGEDEQARKRCRGRPGGVFNYMVCNIGTRTFRLNSGLCVLSKYPLFHVEFSAYENSSGEDKLANKGVLGCTAVLGLASSVVPGMTGYVKMTLFTTHLDSTLQGGSRAKQMTAACEFVDRYHRKYPPRTGDVFVGCVLGGDLNISPVWDRSGRCSGLNPIAPEWDGLDRGLFHPKGWLNPHFEMSAKSRCRSDNLRAYWRLQHGFYSLVRSAWIEGHGDIDAGTEGMKKLEPAGQRAPMVRMNSTRLLEFIVSFLEEHEFFFAPPETDHAGAVGTAESLIFAAQGALFALALAQLREWQDGHQHELEKQGRPDSELLRPRFKLSTMDEDEVAAHPALWQLAVLLLQMRIVSPNGWDSWKKLVGGGSVITKRSAYGPSDVYPSKIKRELLDHFFVLRVRKPLKTRGVWVDHHKGVPLEYNWADKGKPLIFGPQVEEHTAPTGPTLFAPLPEVVRAAHFVELLKKSDVVVTDEVTGGIGVEAGREGCSEGISTFITDDSVTHQIYASSITYTDHLGLQLHLQFDWRL